MLFGATSALTSLTGRTCWLNDPATQREDAVRCYASRAGTATEAVATVANAGEAAETTAAGAAEEKMQQG